jgi:hypothetical protein
MTLVWELQLHMTRVVLLLMIFMGTVLPVRAQGTAGDPPLVGRPGNFSGVVGQYRISAQAEPRTVRVEEPITLTVHIAGTGPEAFRPKLSELRLFSEDTEREFFIEPVPDKTEAFPEKEVWKFVYRLRPKNVDVKFTPGLKLAYYHPGRRKYQTAFADALPIVVEPAAQAPLKTEPARVLRHPERIYQLASGPHVFQADWFTALYWPIVAGGFAAPPLLCWWWVRRWRRNHPGAMEQARRRRSRAGWKALTSLRSPAADPQTTAGVLTEYLHERFGLAPHEPTRPEVDRLLVRMGADKALRLRWRQFLDHSDAQRFAPEATTAPLQDSAAQLIEEVETLAQGAMAPRLGSRSAGQPGPRRGAERWLLLMAALAACSSMGMGWWKKTDGRREHARANLETARHWFEHDQVKPDVGMRFAVYWFGQIAQGYPHADVWHDLGNANILIGDVPAAIVAYRQGLLLAPGDARLRDNLEYARVQVLYPPSGRGRPEAEVWPSWWPRLTRQGWTGWNLALYGLGWLAMAWWWTNGQSAWPRAAVACWVGCAFAGLGWLLYEAQSSLERTQPFVVVARDDRGQGVPFLRGNGASYPPVLELPELEPGMEGRRLAQRGDWLLIRLGSGEIGWVRYDRVL